MLRPFRVFLMFCLAAKVLARRLKREGRTRLARGKNQIDVQTNSTEYGKRAEHTALVQQNADAAFATRDADHVGDASAETRSDFVCRMIHGYKIQLSTVVAPLVEVSAKASKNKPAAAQGQGATAMFASMASSLTTYYEVEVRFHKINTAGKPKHIVTYSNAVADLHGFTQVEKINYAYVLERLPLTLRQGSLGDRFGDRMTLSAAISWFDLESFYHGGFDADPHYEHFGRKLMTPTLSNRFDRLEKNMEWATDLLNEPDGTFTIDMPVKKGFYVQIALDDHEDFYYKHLLAPPASLGGERRFTKTAFFMKLDGFQIHTYLQTMEFPVLILTFSEDHTKVTLETRYYMRDGNILLYQGLAKGEMPTEIKGTPGVTDLEFRVKLHNKVYVAPQWKHYSDDLKKRGRAYPNALMGDIELSITQPEGIRYEPATEDGLHESKWHYPDFQVKLFGNGRDFTAEEIVQTMNFQVRNAPCWLSGRGNRWETINVMPGLSLGKWFAS